MDTDESKTPVTEAPAAEKPAAETPAADTPAAEKPAAEKPADEKPVAEKPKKPLWKRVLKWSLWTIGGLLIFVILALLTLPLWVNPVVTSVANSLVPDYTGTAFKLTRVELNPYTGKLLVSGVQLANPEGYSEKDAFTLGSLSAEVEVSSLLSSTIHVRDVTVDALFASWVFDAAGTNNFDRIIASVNEKLGPKKEKKEEPSETKVVVDKVTVKNVRAAVGTGMFELASLTLTDFGKDTPAKLEISGVKLVNPPGFEAENAFSLDGLSIGMETGDLGTPPFKIHELVFDAPYASYVFDEKKMDNFTRMLEPLLAKKDAPKDEAKAAKKEKRPDAKKEKKADASASPVTLDRLEVKNLKAQVCKGRIELASLVVTDYGKPTAALIKLDDVKLVNPEGFPEPNAFSLKSLSVGIETADLAKKPMVFHDILVDSAYVGLVYDDKGKGNFDVMFEQLNGDEKDGGEKKEEVASAEKDDDDDSPRVVIDKLDISGTKVQYRLVTVPIPLPSFTDIGKNSENGATVKEVAAQVLAQAQGAMGSLGDFAGALGSHATNLLGNATALVGTATNVVGSATALIGSATNVVGGATALIGGATNVVGGATALIGGATNVVGGATGFLKGVLPGGDDKKDDKKEEKKDDGEPGAATKAVEGVKNLGGSAVEGAKNLGGSAVEGAKSLGEGVKNLGGGALKSLGIGK